ncbi:MAG TPA: DUF3089 domain-containing protein [Vicinamibacterales bacterium]|nr:DUF3089 domain-containing protein [Vicinamibacterales bacterium]
MFKQIAFGFALATTLSAPSTARAQQPPAAAPAAEAPKPNDYSDPKTWLCRPGRKDDACGSVDETTTIVAADGKLTRETWRANPNAPIDCFYVYPTISTDPTPNSDMSPDPAEMNVIKQQFARFASVCKPYAPMYRQVTLAGLRRVLAANDPTMLAKGVQYDDVKNAWEYYLQHDNQGRGVALIAHSQGSFILNRLIREEIDGKLVQSRLISATLLGTTLEVPKGKDVGGSFKAVPLCKSATQTGCVIVYASFRSTVPPPANTLFGHVTTPGMEAACVNPAALGGGSGQLHAYLDASGKTITSNISPKPWVSTGPGANNDAKVETPWVSVPGLLTAECKSNENSTYLEVTVHGDPSDPRVDDITGDIGVGTNVLANWGLHLIDVNLSMGNLVDIIGQQAKAYASKKR